MMIIANSEHLGREYKLFDVLDDTAAIICSETYVWSIMRKYGVNVIKTDWPNFVNDYRNRIRERKLEKPLKLKNALAVFLLLIFQITAVISNETKRR